MTSNKVGLRRWIWSSYARSALLPLVCVEVVFLLIYVLANRFSVDENTRAVRAIAGGELELLARQTATAVDRELGAIAQATDFFRHQTERALATPYEAPEAEKSRYAFIHDGVSYATVRDGGAAAFYSGIVPIGDAQKDKAWRTAQLDPIMRDIKESFPLVAQLYVNTSDSLNRIYPYFDVASQYPPKMDIPSYNFYFEADRAHNPDHGVVWTEAYVDPAGQGWMTSAIAPVYLDDTLQAVVGFDVTLSTIARKLTALDVPWEGYALLVSRSGTILAMPAAAESDFGLRELTEYRYEDYILEDTFKPSAFDLRKRTELAGIADDVMGEESGVSSVATQQEQLVSWATVDSTGWKLLVLAPLSNIYGPATELGNELFKIGAWMVVGLVVFYLLFFAWLFRRSNAMARQIQEPLSQMGELVSEISAGRYEHTAPSLEVAELQDTADQIASMGRTLGQVTTRLKDAQHQAEEARDRALESLRLKSQFIATISHELRTPLSVIAGTVEILRDELKGHPMEEFTEGLDTASDSLMRLINDMLDFSRFEAGKLSFESEPFVLPAAVASMVDMLRPSAEAKGLELVYRADDDVPTRVLGDSGRYGQVLSNLVRNAIRFTDQGRVEVHLALAESSGDRRVVRLDVHDTGIGIAESEQHKLFMPFTQVAADPAQRRGGTGLGLSISKQIVEGMGGSVSVVSKTGEGSTFTVTVPFRETVEGREEKAG